MNGRGVGHRTGPPTRWAQRFKCERQQVATISILLPSRLAMSDTTGTANSYEQARLDIIASNDAKLAELGLKQAVDSLADSQPQEQQPPQKKRAVRPVAPSKERCVQPTLRACPLQCRPRMQPPALHRPPQALAPQRLSLPPHRRRRAGRLSSLEWDDSGQGRRHQAEPA